MGAPFESVLGFLGRSTKDKGVDGMESFLDAVGAISLIVLILIGLVAGWIAGQLTGRNTVGYMLLGVVGAVALPFVLAAFGIGIIAAGGLLVLLIVAAIGAIALIALGQLIFGERRR